MPTASPNSSIPSIPDDSRIGIPRLVVSRAVLGSRRISGAIGRALVPHRAAGYNHLIAHESGEMYSIEVSARRFEILHGTDGYMVHTNHYLSPHNEGGGERSGGVDLFARALFPGQSPAAAELIAQPERHCRPFRRTTSTCRTRICNHAVDWSDPLDREKTINALVIDLTVREMHICWGNPCQNAYHTYHLDA